MRQLPSDLAVKLNEKLQTISNEANPIMEVLIARAKSTVQDNTYWTTEIIRELENLGDVSVAPRRFKAYGRPNRLYEIHVRNGQVSTSTREYPDKLKMGFQPEFALGGGSSVAIAFDGHWERYRKLWRLITDENPWIFWVDTSGTLWRQHWNDTATKFVLDTNVTKVKAIRAWKNVNIQDQDQGVLVAYIKTNGSVWYRGYCQQANYQSAWEIETQITSFTGYAVNINLFITNDYRVGFIIEDSTHQIHWFITPRNWGGMALEQHTINMKIKTLINMLRVKNTKIPLEETITSFLHADIALLFARIDNGITHLANENITKINEEFEEYQDWGFKINVKFKYNIESSMIIEVIDSNTSSSFSISNIDSISKTEFNIYIDDTVHEFGMNISKGNIEIRITEAYNAAGYVYDSIIQEFTPLNLDMPDLPLPIVEGIWNE